MDLACAVFLELQLEVSSAAHWLPRCLPGLSGRLAYATGPVRAGKAAPTCGTPNDSRPCSLSRIMTTLLFGNSRMCCAVRRAWLGSTNADSGWAAPKLTVSRAVHPGKPCCCMGTTWSGIKCAIDCPTLWCLRQADVPVRHSLFWKFPCCQWCKLRSKSLKFSSVLPSGGLGMTCCFCEWTLMPQY